MFRFRKPTAAEIYSAVQEDFPGLQGPTVLDPVRGLKVPSLPAGLSHDLLRTRLGSGLDIFESAVRAFNLWRQFDLGWVRVANPAACIEIDQMIAVEVHSLGLWSLNLSRIVSVTKQDHAFGFIYKTTPYHVEEGEERFLLTIDPNSEQVHYELEAVSRPRHWMARLGYPITRSFQHRFARNSHECMRKAVSEWCH